MGNGEVIKQVESGLSLKKEIRVDNKLNDEKLLCLSLIEKTLLNSEILGEPTEGVFYTEGEVDHISNDIFGITVVFKGLSKDRVKYFFEMGKGGFKKEILEKLIGKKIEIFIKEVKEEDKNNVVYFKGIIVKKEEQKKEK